ncbi:LysR family transcriptional regulator [Hahella aquimaris]|uniref:LysR family transcriptional regulator n=1 Tax=Hahella sp. HNIBRBA332 TaxID=3015983 RepID=UPI00273B87F3|nr:LysR family transcriptional regulator [Hahella sp. HNIBRBA332]WLQ13881.1 LysR family transcriptional regulator [Hahella sp. HNIBRBA332]
MDLRELRYFIAVYELGSISAAARRCYVAQPSISAAIQHLEAHLDTMLFSRHSKGVYPSDSAQRLYPLAKKLTSEAQAISQLFRNKPQPMPFSLGLMRSLGAERMSFLLKELIQSVESLELSLVNPEEPCDARIITPAYLRDDEHFQPIWLDRYLLALPAGHSLSLQEQVTLEELDNLPFIHRSPCDALESLQQELRHRKISFLTRANIRTIEYALGLVSAGVGAALAPDWPETRERKDIVLRPLVDVNLELEIGLAYPKKRAMEGPLACLQGLCLRRWEETGAQERTGG